MTEPADDTHPDTPFVRIDENRTRSLGDRLRQVFDEVVAEPLPEALADLLRQLD